MNLSKLFLTAEVGKDCFASGGTSASVILFQTGYYVPGYGEPWEITAKTLDKLKENYDKDTLGSAVSIYYGHWGDRKAAGEIKSLEVVADKEKGKFQLAAKIEWTPAGAKAVKDKEYKYISSEVTTDFRRKMNADKEENHGALLFGAALVNEPGVWDIPQIVFCRGVDTGKEAVNNKSHNKATEDNKMKIWEKLGFKTEQDLEKALKAGTAFASKYELEKTAKEKLEAEVEALKALSEKKEKEAFEKEKAEYLDKLFESGAITKAKHEKISGYDKDKFTMFKNVFGENEEMAPAVPEVKGSPEDGGKPKGLDELGKKYDKAGESEFDRGII